MRSGLCAAVLLALVASQGARAGSTIAIGEPAKPRDPSPWALVGVGLVVGAADYFAGVAAHEGSHALTVELLGGDVVEFSVLPSRRPDGHLMFGHTRWNGDFTDRERAMVLIAPKVLDAALLATYSALLETQNLPDNKYAQLVLVVAATGAWVDFSKDFLTSYPKNDLNRFYDLLGLDEWEEQLPVKLGLMAFSLASAIEVTRGYVKLFSKSDPGRPQVARTGGFVFTPQYFGYSGTF